MAQTYKMMLGTSGKQWEQLTVKDDGTMMLYFHGTDRSVTQQVTAITEGEWKGWLRSEKGSMWPGLESGRWQLMDDVRCKMEDVRPTEGLSPCNPPSATHTGDSPREDSPREDSPREDSPRRQRKPRKPRVERQPSDIEHQPSVINHHPSDISHQTSDTMKAVGMVAAATVALFVIYETGLLIPLGLIGLASGGLLK